MIKLNLSYTRFDKKEFLVGVECNCCRLRIKCTQESNTFGMYIYAEDTCNVGVQL